MKSWEIYTKAHYKTKLSFLFHTQTLKKLCEYCDSNLPIIPVGEVVISSNGNSKIDNSFLFPIKSKDGYLIVWESIEEGKASYVFSTNTYTNESVQNLFNFIAGVSKNKRSTLIQSRDLQAKLKMKERILHNNLKEWDYSIKRLI